jgi:hypothetical protein
MRVSGFLLEEVHCAPETSKPYDFPIKNSIKYLSGAGSCGFSTHLHPEFYSPPFRLSELRCSGENDVIMPGWWKSRRNMELRAQMVIRELMRRSAMGHPDSFYLWII